MRLPPGVGRPRLQDWRLPACSLAILASIHRRRVRQWGKALAPTHGHDLGRDAESNVLRCPRADIQADRCVNAGDLLIGQSAAFETGDAVLARLATTDCPDIARRSAQRGDQSWLVELGIVGEDRDVRARVDPHGIQGFIGPGDDDVVYMRETFARGESLARIHDCHPEAEKLSNMPEGDRGMNAAHEDEVWRTCEDINERLNALSEWRQPGLVVGQ